MWATGCAGARQTRRCQTRRGTISHVQAQVGRLLLERREAAGRQGHRHHRDRLWHCRDGLRVLLRRLGRHRGKAARRPGCAQDAYEPPPRLVDALVHGLWLRCAPHLLGERAGRPLHQLQDAARKRERPAGGNGEGAERQLRIPHGRDLEDPPLRQGRGRHTR